MKNVKHTVHPAAQMAFIDALFAFEGQPTVDDLAAYPQFLILTPEDALAPLTPETDYDTTRDPQTGENFFRRFAIIMEDFGKIIRTLFRMLRQALTPR